MPLSLLHSLAFIRCLFCSGNTSKVKAAFAFVALPGQLRLFCPLFFSMSFCCASLPTFCAWSPPPLTNPLTALSLLFGFFRAFAFLTIIFWFSITFYLGLKCTFLSSGLLFSLSPLFSFFPNFSVSLIKKKLLAEPIPAPIPEERESSISDDAVEPPPSQIVPLN